MITSRVVVRDTDKWLRGGGAIDTRLAWRHIGLDKPARMESLLFVQASGIHE
jgi:hypothetical protein